MKPLEQEESKLAQEENLARQPVDGQEVYARVTKVEDRFSKVEILAVQGHPVRSVFVGII